MSAARPSSAHRRARLRLDEDWHVHSRWSDGEGTLEQNVEAAAARGLRRLVLVDHVRRDTDWAGRFAAAVAALRRHAPLALACGVEAKLLDTGGSLDLPADLSGVDVVHAADHQLPSPDGPLAPDVARARIEGGDLDAGEAVAWLAAATEAAIRSCPRPLVLAHLFSVLPKLGLREDAVPRAAVDRLARAAARHAAVLEVSERWATPSADVAARFCAAGVEVVASTDAHHPGAIGRYAHCVGVAAALAGGTPPTACSTHSTPAHSSS